MTAVAMNVDLHRILAVVDKAKPVCVAAIADDKGLTNAQRQRTGAMFSALDIDFAANRLVRGLAIPAAVFNKLAQSDQAYFEQMLGGRLLTREQPNDTEEGRSKTLAQPVVVMFDQCSLPEPGLVKFLSYSSACLGVVAVVGLGGVLASALGAPNNGGFGSHGLFFFGLSQTFWGAGLLLTGAEKIMNSHVAAHAAELGPWDDQAFKAEIMRSLSGGQGSASLAPLQATLPAKAEMATPIVQDNTPLDVDDIKRAMRARIAARNSSSAP